MKFKDPLPEEEQIRLLTIKDTPGVRDQLIIHNLRLVQWVALQYHKQGSTELDDLFQIGVIGLIKSIEKYDVDRGAKFSTIAVWYIRTEITRNLFKFTNDLSLDTPTVDGEDITLQDTIEDIKVNIHEDVTSKLFIDQLKKEFKPKLTDLQFKIVILSYGLNGKDYTSKEIADMLNQEVKDITLERNKALRIMRKIVIAKGIERRLDDRTSFIKAVDYSQERIIGGERISPVERLVLSRERQRDYMHNRVSILFN